MWNAFSPGFELVSPCPIPATITITPRHPTVMTVTLCLSCSLDAGVHSIGVSEGPLGRVWLSLPHLVSSCLELYWQLLATALARRTQLNYIIFWLPLDLWNRMFNRHQAEITVMQFRGHSLPVHHSVVYHGNFFCSSHFISQFPTARFPLITAIRMYHFLPVHHLEWHFLAGSKGQNITVHKLTIDIAQNVFINSFIK